MRLRLGILLTVLMVRPCGAKPGPYDPPIPKTSNALEKIYRHYGAACFGMDWRLLRAVAEVESSQDPERHDGEKVGLFMLRPGVSKKSDCGANIRPFKKLFKCKDLEDPELNTAVAAGRLDHLFTGARLKGENKFKDDEKVLGIAKICRGGTVRESMILAYVGITLGTEVLQHVLHKAQDDPKACAPGTTLEGALASFYEDHKKSRTDGRRRKGFRSVDCPNKEEIIGRKAYRCVDAPLALREYKEILRKAQKLDLGSDQDRVTAVYPKHATDHALCPPFREGGPRRLFKCRDKLISINLTAPDSPCGR